MNNLFQNKFFITFLILAIAIYGLSTRMAQASGVFNWISYIVIAVIVVFMPYLIPSLFGGGVLTLMAEFGIAAGFVACQFGSDNVYWSDCGSNIGGMAITSPMLIPSMAGECRVGLVLPSFYEPWSGQSIGTASAITSGSKLFEDPITYTNYLSSEVNKFGGEYKDLPLSDVSLSGNVFDGSFTIEYNVSTSTKTIVPKTIATNSSKTMSQFRQSYGDIILKGTFSAQQQSPGPGGPSGSEPTYSSTSTPEQFIKDGRFFSAFASTNSGYKATVISDIENCSVAGEFNSNCQLLFQPKGKTIQYPIINFGSFLGDSQRASYSKRPTFSAFRIISPPLDESEFDAELYRFALPDPKIANPNLTDKQLKDILTAWYYNVPYLGGDKVFSITAGPGIYNFSLGSQNILMKIATTTYPNMSRYWTPPNDGHFYRFKQVGVPGYTEPTATPEILDRGNNVVYERVKISSYKYKNVCAVGICNLIDHAPPEGKYLIYIAKIKGNFGQIYEYVSLPSTLIPVASKYLNVNKLQSSWFSWYWNNCDDDGCDLYKGDSNIAYGPLAPIVLPSQDSCEVAADVRITAVSCDAVTLLTTVPFVDQAKFAGYDVYRDNNLIASNIPINQPVFEDKGLSKRMEYTYKVVVKTTDGMAQDFNLPAVKTVCIPECSLSASPNSLVYPSSQTKVSWQCQEADSCILTSSNLPENYPTADQFCSSINGSIKETGCQVNNTSYASPSLTLDQTTTFILACQNIDGASTNAATVDFLRPKRMEIIPR